MTAEIPIWVFGKQLWVTGVDKRTTVNDVVASLLGRPDKEYSLVEKWCRVERPLNGDTRLLRLWKTWGDDWKNVKLSLKKIATTENEDSGRSSPTSSFCSRQRRRRSRHRNSNSSSTGGNANKKTAIGSTTTAAADDDDDTLSCCKYGQTIHPRRLSQLSKTQNIEKLLKLILLQGETIQNQISKLRDKDSQIEYFENEQHRNRVRSLGCNYLLETYLGGGSSGSGVRVDDATATNVVVMDKIEQQNNDKEMDEEEKADSGVATECTPSSECTTSTPTGEDSKDDDEDEEDEEINDDDDDDDRRKLPTIEEDFESEMRKLHDKIRLLEKITKINKKIEKEEENLVRLYINIERCKKNDKLMADLTSSLERLKNQSDQSETEFKRNSVILNDMEGLLDARKCYLNKLQREINADDHHQTVTSNDDKNIYSYNNKTTPNRNNNNNYYYYSENNNNDNYNSLHPDANELKLLLFAENSCSLPSPSPLSTCPKNSNSEPLQSIPSSNHQTKHILDTLV